ncbi:MAG: hypothetical protein WB715_25530 [Roseiarcus sp.]|uniref:hypothetical protein n=1 Tax=Roseiarcus sp. TaxID=1969460 RepID=UPI003C39D527
MQRFGPQYCKHCPIRLWPARLHEFAETFQAMGRDPAGGIPAAEVAHVVVRQLREGASVSVASAART